MTPNGLDFSFSAAAAFDTCKHYVTVPLISQAGLHWIQEQVPQTVEHKLS